MVHAVLFDMDGLMIDSELIQSQSFEAVLREYGKKPVYNEQGVVHTVGIRDNWLLLKEKYGIKEEIDILTEKKRRIYWNLLHKNLTVMPGLMTLLNRLKEIRVKKAVVSSSLKESITLVATQLNIQKHFDALISGYEVKHGKPAPDIYLEATKRLEVSPPDCVVLEDSFNGLQSAKNAGMKVIVIPNKYTAHHDFSSADKVMRSLEDINWNIINNL